MFCEGIITRVYIAVYTAVK